MFLGREFNVFFLNLIEFLYDLDYVEYYLYFCVIDFLMYIRSIVMKYMYLIICIEDQKIDIKYGGIRVFVIYIQQVVFKC